MRSPGHRGHRAHNKIEMDFNSNRLSLSSQREMRSLNPHQLDDSRQIERLDGTSDLIEMREYYRGGGLVCQNGPNEQKSPSYQRMAKQPLLDLVVNNRDYKNPTKYELEPFEPSDNNFVDGESSYRKNFYRDEHDDSRLAYGNEINYNGERSPSNLNWKKDQIYWKGDTNMGELNRSYQDVLSALYYGKTRIHIRTPLNVDMELSQYEKIKYPCQVASEKLSIVESHEDKEHLVLDSSETALHHRATGFDYRDLRNTYQIAETGRASSKLAGNNGWGSYQAREMVASSQDFSRRCDEYDPTDHMRFKVYKQRPEDSVIDSDEGNRSSYYYQQGVCSPRNAREDYFYSKLHGTTNHAQMHPQGSSKKRIHLHNEMDCSLEHSEGDYQAPRLMDTTMGIQKDNTGSYASLVRNSMIEGHPTLTRKSISDYRDLGSAEVSIKQGSRFIDARHDHVEVGWVPRDYRMSHSDDSQYSRVSRMKTEYKCGREEKLKCQEEKFPHELSGLSVSRYEPNHRSMDWLQTREMYDSCKQVDENSFLGRKYIHEKEISTYDYEIAVSGEYDDEASREYHNLYSNDRDVIAMDSTRENRFKNEKNRNSKRTYNQYEYFQSDDLLPSQEYYRNKQMQSSKVQKNWTRFMKANPRNGSFSGNSPHHFGRRNRHDKNHVVWDRIEFGHNDVHGDDDDPLEEMNDPTDPPENSEEFMQLVLDAFFKYSKQLNCKASTRERYKGKGKSSSLSCIVCGLSLSKEFKDTQSLLRHACMSRKVGLRAQHLGLLKAVCVMLGWNVVVPRNVGTWTPEVLPCAEALAQKEDLIIWPPIVVVRNISLLDNAPDNWRLVTTEALEAFLRSKGFIRGSVKEVCVGRPADQSVMVVKFVGTFSGLGDAERIHQYFEQKKRGRVESEKRMSKRRKRSSGFVVINEGEKIEEQVLFGYMGIAEDLEEVDLKANNSSVIKSKKEIHEWDKAPIKEIHE